MIDLHIHTNYSDGTDSLREVLKKAEMKKMEVISITDHDKIGAYIELENNPELRKLYHGQIIIGSELRAVYKGVSIEVLAYGFDYRKLKIHEVDNVKVQNECLKKFKNLLDENGFKYDDKNLYIDVNDPTKQWASFVIGTELLKYPENADLIKKIGDFTPTSFFRVHQCNKKSIFYIDESQNFIELNELISRIHEAGGLAFLAHGYIYPFEDKDSTIEEILRTTKIDGIECEYPLFSSNERLKARTFAERYSKYKSGGTDYHAKNKPEIELGSGINNNINISKEFIQEWFDKVRKI